MSFFSVLCEKEKKAELLFSPIKGNFILSATSSCNCSVWILSVLEKGNFSVNQLTSTGSAHFTLGYSILKDIHSFYLELHSIDDIPAVHVHITIHDLTCVPSPYNVQNQQD